MADQQSKILTPHLITFYFENLCEHRFSCETRTSVCLDGGLDGWWCVEKRVARTLRVFLSKNPFPATARPTGPNVEWVHAPILWCASSNCSQHTGYMCKQAWLYTHTGSVFWGVLLIWKHNSLQIRRETASLSSTIKFLWWLWCSSQWECTNTGYL